MTVSVFCQQVCDRVHEVNLVSVEIVL